MQCTLTHVCMGQALRAERNTAAPAALVPISPHHPLPLPLPTRSCLQAKAYLNKLPAQMSKDDLVVVADPMLATGGTITKVRVHPPCTTCGMR